MGALSAGPVIGVLTGRVEREAATSGTQAELAMLSLKGREVKGSVYVFTPQGIDWERKLVRGLNYDGVSWREDDYPLPDVVYNQLYVRRQEREHQELCRRLMRQTGGHFFNTRYLNKLEVHQLLIRDSTFRSYLPATRRLNQVRDLERALAAHGSVYLKPVGGSLGQGIMRVRQVSGGYLCQDRCGEVSGIVATVEQAFQLVQRVKMDRSYLVQQDLQLAAYQGRIFDFRILIQKDGGGKWRITKVYTRLAPPGGIASNLALGGIPCQADQLLPSVCADNYAARATVTAIKQLSNSVASALETRSGLLLGELGIDIGIDTRGKIWLIEINSKPRRSTATTGRMKLVDLSFLRPLEYAAHLALVQAGN